VQGGEGATVRDRCDRCGGRCDDAIGAAVGATVGSVRRGGSGWLGSSISGSTFFLSREREIEQRTAGVAGGASGWLAGWLGVAGGVAGGDSGRQRAESRAESREQRAESEKRDREVK
jgi:hypothetical protein